MQPNLSITSKLSVEKRIASNAGLMMGAKFLAVILGFGSMILASKNLTLFDFGIILFLHAYMVFFSEVATFQVWQSIIRFGADDIKKNDAGKLASLLNFGIKLDALAAFAAFGLSIITFGLLTKVTSHFSNFVSFDVKDIGELAGLYCLLLFFRQRDTSIGIFRLFDKFNVLAVQGLIQPSARFIGVVIATYFEAGLEGFLLAWFIGALVSFLFLPSLAVFELKRRKLLKLVFTSAVSLRSPREGVWPFVIKSNIDSSLGAASTQLPAILVMGVFGSTWVAVYRVAEEASKLLSEGFKLLDKVIYPELAKMVSIGHASKIWPLVTRTAILLLGFGLAVSVIVIFAGPKLLTIIFSEDYLPAAPLASLLVLAAAITGIAAPLYPVLYAADRPERAIYARATGVLVYVLAFFIFSYSIGEMAPGWAALLANSCAVLVLVFLARQTLNRKILDQNPERHVKLKTFTPALNLVGTSDVKIWGMPVATWQLRAFKKAGVAQGQSSKFIHIGVEWILSSTLMKNFVSRESSALISDGKIIAVNGGAEALGASLIGQQSEALIGTGISPLYSHDLDDGYNKTLRKKDPPYAIDLHATAPVDVMKRQFGSSYKGITDFVTKWVWPLPAFYVTRLCASLRLTPNMVTTIGFFLMCAAFYYFWLGEWVLGFLTGWLMTFLDTVDGKLARTTMTYSSWGNIYDHGIDLIHPPFWYWAWFIGLGGSFVWTNIMSDVMTLALAAICIGYVVDRIIEGIFIAQHGFHIHVWRPINSRLRFIAARRNPNMVIFMVGVCFTPWFPDAAKWGFYAVAYWTWFCIAFNAFVIIFGVFKRQPLQSWMES